MGFASVELKMPPEVFERNWSMGFLNMGWFKASEAAAKRVRKQLEEIREGRDDPQPQSVSAGSLIDSDALLQQIDITEKLQ
jgi:hypothetical protein